MSARSVTRWMNELREGDETAANRLWYIVQQRVCRTAKAEVARSSHAAYDEEDVANSAFNSLCSGFQAGRYDDVADRQQLWRLLSVITVNKARKRARHETRLRRGGGTGRVSNGDVMIGTVASGELEPADMAIMQEECRRLLNMLGKRDLKVVAMLRVEGYTNQEIAEQLGCTRRTIQRRLDLIRQVWSEELP